MCGLHGSSRPSMYAHVHTCTSRPPRDAAAASSPRSPAACVPPPGVKVVVAAIGGLLQRGDAHISSLACPAASPRAQLKSWKKKKAAPHFLHGRMAGVMSRSDRHAGGRWESVKSSQAPPQTFSLTLYTMRCWCHIRSLVPRHRHFFS